MRSITALGTFIALLFGSASAQGQSSSVGRYQESAVFDQDLSESAATQPQSHYAQPYPAERPAVHAEPAVEEPRQFTPPASTTPLKLAPAKASKRIVPTVAATPEQQLADNPPAPGKLVLQPPKKHQSGAIAASPGLPSASTMIGSLAIVVGLFLLVAWVMRRGMPQQTPLLPKGILEVLGRAPLVGRQQVHLVRLGNKLLLLAITPGGIETLTEVTDPVEIDRLSGICQQAGPFSSTKAFNQVLGDFADPQSGKRGSFSKAEPDFTSLAAGHNLMGKRERNRA